MAIFDEIGKKISKTTQDAVKGTKDFAEVSRLNTQISDEQNQINSFFMQIGKKYYELSPDTTDENFMALCGSISESRAKVDNLRNEVDRIKGIKRCSNCGSEIPRASIFCGSCGHETSKDAPPAPTQPKLVCPNCNKEQIEGSAFCTDCGQKL